MKIAVSIVFYNPLKENTEQIKDYLSFFDLVIVIDNSNSECSEVARLAVKNNHLLYLPLFQNRGIAYALNKALEEAEDKGCDFLLTMDQDSKYPFDKHKMILNKLSAVNWNNTAIYAMLPQKEYEKQNTFGIEQVTTAITSGNFINLRLIKKYNISFSSPLFIDCVDFEFDRLIIRKGLNILQDNGICFKHSIGNPIRKKIFGKKFYCRNHSPVRYYYRFRNITYLINKDKEFYQKIYFKTRVIDFWKRIFFEPNKKSKLKRIRQGIKDAKKNVLGPFVADSKK